MIEIILASGSPQRKRILQKMGIRFQAIPSHIDESPGKLKKPHAIAKKIALDKALSVSKNKPNQWVLGCDTFVVMPNKSISLKPKNREEAKETLLMYSNAHCDVYSGIAMVNKSLKKVKVSYEKTRLYFKKLSEKEIENYLDLNEWEGSSGSMTIEGTAGKWITKRVGDYWNVVGLPIKKLNEMMGEIS